MATITEISNSAATVWEALVVFEDTRDEESARAALGTVSEADRRLFEEELAHEVAKLHRAAAYEAPAARSTIAARNAAAAERSGAHVFEGAILARQEDAAL